MRLRRVLELLLAVFLLRWSAPWLVPLGCALVLTLAGAGMVEALQRRRVPGAIAAAIVVGVPAVVVMGLTGTLADLALRHWDRAALDPRGLDAWLARLDAGGGLFESAAHWLRTDARLDPQAITQAVTQAIAPGVGAGLLSTTATLLLVFFALTAQRSLLAALLAAMPDARARRRLLGGLREARAKVASYVYVVVLANAGLAVATGIALAAIGLAHSVLWAGAAFVLAFVPYLGPLATALLLLLAGAAQFGESIALPAPALVYLVLHGVEANLISPWLMGRQLRISRLAVLVTVLVGSWCWGLIGGVLAVPLLVIAQVALRRRPGHRVLKALLRRESAGSPWPAGRD